MEKKFKIRKDDTVQVIAGKDKGKRGTVVRVIAKKDAVIVSGVNMVKKAMRKRSQQDQGGIAEIEAPLNISNVAYVKNAVQLKLDSKLTATRKLAFAASVEKHCNG